MVQKPQTLASQWAEAAQGTKIMLPSGKEAIVRQPSLEAMLMENGAIPDTVFTRLFPNNGKTPEQLQADMAALSPPEQAQAMRDLMAVARRVTMDAFVSPKLVEDAGGYDAEADTLPIKFISPQDQMFMLAWAQQGGDAGSVLGRFLQQFQRGTGVSTVPDGGDLSETAE